MEESRKVSTEQGQQLAKNLRAKFIEIRYDENIRKIDKKIANRVKLAKDHNPKCIVTLLYSAKQDANVKELFYEAVWMHARRLHKRAVEGRQGGGRKEKCTVM